LLFLIPVLANAQDRSQARSMVIITRGIVATSQTLASQVGAQILTRADRPWMQPSPPMPS